MRYFPALIVAILIVGCRASLEATGVKEATAAINTYETVNSVPQFADDEDHFLLYWAIWRQLSSDERVALGTSEGAILSQRNISWTVSDCQTDKQINKDGENIWYLDQLTFDANGQIKSIKEATRPGYRYFNMLNLNSQHLRGAGPFDSPKKLRGEKMEDWDKRRHKAFLEWLDKSWAKGTKGEVVLLADHRLVVANKLISADAWIKPEDYPKLTGPLLETITKYSPSRWPVFFDERAHKPHMFSEPKSWQQADRSISSRKFRMRLKWDWCNVSAPVVAELFVPRGEMPPPGPNRAGRSDSGQKSIKVNEIDWPG